MLKGHAKIELTDVNTGKVEIHEHNNLITNALPENLSFASKILGTNAGAKFLPLYNLGMGGILLYENPLIEGVTNTMLPVPSENALTGYASNNAYGGTDTKRGSRNITESGAVENGYKFVYDFATSQGNGIISSVALTSSKTGATPYAYNSNGYYNQSNVSIYETHAMDFDFDTNIMTELLVNGTKGLTVRKVRLPIDKVRIRTQFLTTELVSQENYDYTDSSITFNASSKVIDSNDEYYYIAYCQNTNLSFCRVYKSDYSIDTEYGKKSVTLSINAPVDYSRKNAVVLNGYMYVCYTGGSIHRVNINDVSDYEVINTGVSSGGITCAILGNSIITNSYVYSEDENGSPVIVIRPTKGDGIISSASSNCILAFENGIVFETDFKNSIYRIWVGSTFDYLATINNLDTPIEKTSAQTMKITYTLTEA